MMGSKNKIIITLLVLLGLPSLCLAQEQGGVVSSHQENQASVCTIEDMVDNKQDDSSKIKARIDAYDLVSAATEERDSDIFISPYDIPKQLNETNVVLVDVRDSELYHAYRIPHSINIPANRLKTKNNLKRKSLVLVSDGYKETGLVQLRIQLMGLGFENVTLLEGGLNGWRERVGELVGSGVGLTDINQIKARDLLSLKKYKHWSVVSLDQWREVSGNSKTDQVAYLHSIKPRYADNIVISTNDGKGYEQIKSLVNEMGWKSVYYLKGGRSNYDAVLKQQQALWGRVPGKQGGESRCGGRV